MVNIFKSINTKDLARKSNERDFLLGPNDSKLHKWYMSWNVLIFFLFVILGIVCILIFIVSSLSNRQIEKEQLTRLTSVATINNDYFKYCGTRVTCDKNAKYRSINGSCNNLLNPLWGASMTPFYRYIDPEFSDGVSKFRVQSDGSPLPNSRLLTITLFQNISTICDNKNNELLVPWGQFIAHDLAYTPVNSINSTFPDALDHCQDDNPPVECEAVIKLSPLDPVYGKYNMSILKFIRAITSTNYSCPLIPATVLNHNTHYIDASNVYGSDTQVANELRLFNSGKLIFNKIGKETYCPQDPSKTTQNGNQTQEIFAFLAGDVNVNQNLAIALFQNLFLRFHNYVADILKAKHPLWTDETIYQEARRIVISAVQVITYDQFLPIVLGEKYMEEYGLNKATNYDPKIFLSVSQEMTSGAYRLLHNIIPAQFDYMSNNYTIYEVEEPSATFLRPDSIVGNVDGFLRGLMENPGRIPQSSYNKLISNIVITVPSIDVTGFDLLSYDIQRGRDVGLPPYNVLRKFCGLPLARSFEDLLDHIPLEKIDQLKTFYSSVDDIDFYVGILLENNGNGSKVGPTGRCIIADSFYRFRNGDRFFYDVQGQAGSFTPDQIASLKNITLSHIICATSNIKYVQTNTFNLVDHIRMMKLKHSCDTYKIDMRAW